MSVQPPRASRPGRRALLAAPLLLAARPAIADPRDAPDAASLLIPAPPGGANWLLAGLLAEEMHRRLGLRLARQSRPSPRGAGYGIEALLTKPADGTWLAYVQSSHVLLPLAFPGLPFDPVQDFLPVGGWVETPHVVLVRADLPVDDLRGLFALIRSQPGQHRYASGGRASTQTLASAALLQAGRAHARPLQFGGSGPARAALAAGQVSFVLDMAPTAFKAAAEGRLRVLAVGAPERLAAAPQVPTFAESSGIDALQRFDIGVFGLVLAPRATPEAAVAPIRRAMAEALDDTDVRRRLAQLGSVPLALGDEAAARAFLLAQRMGLEELARRLDDA